MEIRIVPTATRVTLSPDGVGGIVVGGESEPGIPARAWHGVTTGGLHVTLVVSLVGVEPEDQAAFEAELAAAGGSTVLVPAEPSAGMRRLADPGRN